MHHTISMILLPFFFITIVKVTFFRYEKTISGFIYEKVLLSNTAVLYSWALKLAKYKDKIRLNLST